MKHCFAYRGLFTSIGYGGNGKAYMTPTRTLFDWFTLFVYDSFVYPSDISLKYIALAVDGMFFPIFSYKQTRGGSYHCSYKLAKEQVSLSPSTN